MRVSNNMNYDQVKGNIGRNRSDLAELQNQASTMKRITKPSDDPVGTARMLTARTDKVGTEQFLRNMDMAKTFLNFTESALGDLSNILMRAKELAISQASDASSNTASRMATAREVDEIFNESVNIGNRKFADRYIFGGYKTTESPFDNEGGYHGDGGNIKIEVAKGVYSEVNLPGDRAFLGKLNKLAQIPEDRRGATTPNYPKPPEQPEQKKEIPIRGPASVEDEKRVQKTKEETEVREEQQFKQGESVFAVLKSLSDGLKANDTVAVQETLERLDDVLGQVVLLRSEVGSRSSVLDNTYEGLTKAKIDDSTLLSSVEDADPFEVFSDITKNENALKATLQTSGKLIQPSLLDFLR